MGLNKNYLFKVHILPQLSLRRMYSFLRRIRSLVKNRPFEHGNRTEIPAPTTIIHFSFYKKHLIPYSYRSSHFIWPRFGAHNTYVYFVEIKCRLNLECPFAFFTDLDTVEQ